MREFDGKAPTWRFPGRLLELLPFVLLLGFAACTPPKEDTPNAGDSIGYDTYYPDTADTGQDGTDETAHQVDTGDVPDEWSVHRRSRTQDEDGTWQVNEWTETWEPSETVILVIDMWAGYGSVSATHNVTLLAPLMNDAFADARARGVRVIWAPANGGTSSYEDTPQRQMMEDAPYSELPISWTWWYPEPWEYDYFALLEEGHSESGDPDNIDSRQTDALTIEPDDGISEDLQEMWNWFTDNHIQHVILTGMYTNYCILGRPWGLRALDAAGMDAVVVRELTDSQGSVFDRPYYTSHDRITDLSIEHIERFWASTIPVDDLRGTPTEAPSPLLDATFDDGDVFFEPYEGFRWGSGVYNLSEYGHDYPADTSILAEETDGNLVIGSRLRGSLVQAGAVITRMKSGFREDDSYQDGLDFSVSLDASTGLASADPCEGVTVGVMDAGGTVDTPGTHGIAPQIFVSLRDGDGDGHADGEVCACDTSCEVMDGTTFGLEWEGLGDLGMTFNLSTTGWEVTFDQPLSLGPDPIAGSLPLAFEGVEEVHATVANTDPTEHSIAIDAMGLLRSLKQAGNLQGR